jgi:membrane protease subunit (stomatin/prohibitin family)
VTDAEKLVVNLAGLRQGNDEVLGWYKGQVLKVIRDRTAELLVKKKWPLLDVTSGAYTEEIEQEVLAGVKPHVDSYGIVVVRMGNFTISIKEEDELTLKKLSKDVAYSRLAGGFQQYAQGQAMLGAAEGMAKGGDGGGGGGMLQGAGLGVGFGMAQMFQNQQQPHPQQAPVAAAAAVGGQTCPKCNAQGVSGKFCANCGQPLSAAPKKCECGNELAPGAKFCANCGKPA